MGRKTITMTVREKMDGSRILKSEKQIITPEEVDMACPICQEPVGKQTPEGTVEGWSELPCGHRFGSFCIKHYLGITAEDSPACPICRQAAHHSRCGHPVLPAMLNLRDANRSDSVSRPIGSSKKIKNRVNKLEQVQNSYCGYCEGVRGSRALDRASTGKAHRRWTAPFRWLRIFDFRSIRSPRGRIVIDAEALAREQQHWATEFWKHPRSRDPGWESWWDKQLPSTPKVQAY